MMGMATVDCGTVAACLGWVAWYLVLLVWQAQPIGVGFGGGTKTRERHLNSQLNLTSHPFQISSKQRTENKMLLRTLFHNCTQNTHIEGEYFTPWGYFQKIIGE